MAYVDTLFQAVQEALVLFLLRFLFCLLFLYFEGCLILQRAFAGERIGEVVVDVTRLHVIAGGRGAGGQVVVLNEGCCAPHRLRAARAAC